MKKFILLLIFLPALALGQNLEVKSIEEINTPAKQDFYHPKISSEGDFILLTSENYKGLSIYRIDNENIEQISDKNGVGYQVSFDDANILYAEDTYVKGRKHADLKLYNIDNKKSQFIEKSIRNLVAPKISQNTILYNADKQLKNVALSKKKIAESVPVVGIKNKKIVLFDKGEEIIINPYENDSYIWPSISPNEEMIVSYSMKKGAFITDMKGNIKKELGHIEAPVWMGNDMILGMETCDDGKHILYSAIVLVNLSTDSKEKISPEGVIAMYPHASYNVRKIVYNSINGNIYLVTLK